MCIRDRDLCVLTRDGRLHRAPCVALFGQLPFQSIDTSREFQRAFGGAIGGIVHCADSNTGLGRLRRGIAGSQSKLILSFSITGGRFSTWVWMEPMYSPSMPMQES